MDGTKLLLNKITFSNSMMQPKTSRMNIIRTVSKVDSILYQLKMHSLL